MGSGERKRHCSRISIEGEAAPFRGDSMGDRRELSKGDDALVK